MQDVDRPAHVQALPQPPRSGGPRVQDSPLGIVLCVQDLDGIAEHLQRRRHLGQRPPVRTAESKLAIRLSIELVALLVNAAAREALASPGVYGPLGRDLSEAAATRRLPTQKAVKTVSSCGALPDMKTVVREQHELG